MEGENSYTLPFSNITLTPLIVSVNAHEAQSKSGARGTWATGARGSAGSLASGPGARALAACGGPDRKRAVASKPGAGTIRNVGRERELVRCEMIGSHTRYSDTAH